MIKTINSYKDGEVLLVMALNEKQKKTIQEFIDLTLESLDSLLNSEESALKLNALDGKTRAYLKSSPEAQIIFSTYCSAFQDYRRIKENLVNLEKIAREYREAFTKSERFMIDARGSLVEVLIKTN